MKKLLLAALMLAPTSAFAEHMDVIELEFVDGCNMTKLAPIVADFNAWGADHGYHAKIAVPLQSNNLANPYWLGTTATAAAFGAAWDAWRDAQADAKSTPAKLQERFDDCTKNLARRSYDVY